MRFGTTMQEDATRASSGGGRWMKNLKAGDTTIRFLEDLNDWTPFWEHFNQAKQQSFPCTGEKSTCPGCTDPDERSARSSKRYLVNALVGDYVDLYKIPVSLINKVNRRADQDNGTILKRDYLIVKSGKGLNTEYDMDREEATRINIDDYADKMQDHQEALRNAYIEAWGSLPDEVADGEGPQAAPTPVKRAPRKPKTLDPEPTEMNDAQKLIAEARAMPQPKADDLPPSEPQSESDAAAEGDEDEEILSEEEIREMSESMLLSLYERTGITPPDVDGSPKEREAALADFLIEALVGEEA